MVNFVAKFRQSTTSVFVLGLCSLALWAGCTGSAPVLAGPATAAASTNQAPAAMTATPAAIATPSATATPPSEKLFRFRVVYDKPKNKDYALIEKTLRESHVYDDLARQLSLTYQLPRDVVIRFTELDEENAYFDTETYEITVGYELVDYYRQIFEVDANDPDAVKQEILDAPFFTLMHEVGHALIALFEIPITGREEDAVDEFATLALLEMNDEQSEAALLSGIEQFAVDAEDYESIEELPFADEHSLDRQRFYQVLSLVYGSDPEAYEDYVGGDYLPEERAEYSESEYEQKLAVWRKLLDPHKR